MTTLVSPSEGALGSIDGTRAGISWAAVFGGAVVATAVTFMLLALGSGLGLAFASPVSDGNPSAVTFTVMAAIWLIVVQWISSFFGGYLAGRLRGGLSGFHTDEITFRDTASGFVAWAAASVFVIGLISSGASSFLGGAAHSVTAVAASATGGGVSSSSSDTSGYLVDSLLRPSQPSPQEDNASSKAEAARILATGVTGTVSQPDRDYLKQLVAARTGLSSDDAGKRVDDIISRESQAVEKAKQVANAARKAASSFAIYTFFSMLVGAFIACVAGAIGGRQRDAY
jgi:hypothetical protein